MSTVLRAVLKAGRSSDCNGESLPELIMQFSTNHAQETLLQTVAPPADAVNRAGDWQAKETQLGVTLPDDFKWFVENYGSGQVGDLYIHSVFADKVGCDLAQWHSGVVRAYQDLSADGGDEIPYSLFPATGGLLSWGSTGNGDYLHWSTRGKPDDWNIVAWECSLCEFHSFDGGFVEFLAAIVTGRMTWEMFPRVLYQPPFDFMPG